MANKNKEPTKDHIAVEMGKRLRDIRGDMSLDEFCPLVGVSKSSLARYERGEGYPDAEFIGLLVENFTINATWFVYGTGNKYVSMDDLKKTTSHNSPKILSLDLDLLTEVIQGVEECLSENEARLTASKMAKLISLLYDHFLKTTASVDNETIERFLQLAS